MAKAHLHLTIDEAVKAGLQEHCSNISEVAEKLFVGYLTWARIYKEDITRDIGKRVADEARRPSR